MAILLRQFIGIILLTLGTSCVDTDAVYDAFAEECDGLDPKLIPLLRQEIDSLEAYFVDAGLLEDATGDSYYAVYEQIALDNDLLFAVEKDFALLDSIPPDVLQHCFLLALENPDLSEITLRYLTLVYQIYTIGAEGGDITPGRIAHTMKPEDFNTELLRLSSLITFYLIATPTELVPRLLKSPSDSLFGAVLYISGEGQLSFEQQPAELADITKRVAAFVWVDPQHRAVQLLPEQETSYSFYQTVTDSVKQAYYSLWDEASEQSYQRPFKQLDETEQATIRQKIPQLIIYP